MMEWLLGLLSDFWQTHALWLMFASAFLSATVLPGNSEIIFIVLAIPKLALGTWLSTDIFLLIFMATLGNGLGSLTTYGIGRWLPQFRPKKSPHFMGYEAASTLWFTYLTIKLATYSRRFILCPSGLA